MHQFLIAVILLTLGCSSETSSQPVSDSDITSPSLLEGVIGKVVSVTGGHPIHDAIILPKSLDDPPLLIPELGIVTDTEGRYEWPLSPGAYAITVFADGYQQVTQEVKFTEGELITLDFFLQRE